jgi:hypothetical protein
MLTLGEVVKIQKPAQKDHSNYQEWVAGEYLRILHERDPERLGKLKELTDRKGALIAKRDPLLEKLNVARNVIYSSQRKYFEWLYENDRSTWVILDPIVSVQKDGTFFEAFSGDESIYARVFLPHSAMESASAPSLGTTNIDFSLLLERELSRVRSYRPLSLQVGLNSVEVQSVLALAPTVFEMSSDALAEILSRLLAEKEKQGPRALVFRLVPEEPIRVEIQPWGEVYSDDWCSYEGSTTQEIRVWGRRRLSVLKDILVHTDRVTVHLLGSGMPSFWTVVKDGVELTVGLSGWSSNDWASKAKFSSFIPTANVKTELLESALAVLVKSGQVTTASLSAELSITVPEASVILQKLCLKGKAMFDPSRAVYRWRDLFPTFDSYDSDQKDSLESRKGLELFQKGSVTVVSDDVKDQIRYLVGDASIDGATYKPLLELDADNRPKFAQCNCSHYNYHKLRQGPCRHMIALSLAGDSK